MAFLFLPANAATLGAAILALETIRARMFLAAFQEIGHIDFANDSRYSLPWHRVRLLFMVSINHFIR